mmetsp:Transcript_12580/g.20971  ORF Transcript_12580/g.20971 Transcript_12580/m.20971 type:complete len:119 (-) Transcript_12580:1259-1615(-)
MVVLGHGAFSLVHLNRNRGLVILMSRKDLRLFSRNSRLALDDGGHDTADCLNTEGKRRDVQHDDCSNRVVCHSAQDTTLDSGTIGNRLVWVDTLGEFLAIEEFRQHFLNLGDTGGAAN